MAKKTEVTQKKKTPTKSKSKKTSVSRDEFNSMVANRAYQLFEERGCRHGSHEDDWFRAEQELQAKVC